MSEGEIRTSQLERHRIPALAGGGALLLLVIVWGFFSPDMFFRSWLFAWIGYAKDGGIRSASSIALQFICVRIYYCTMHMHNYVRTHVKVNARSARRRDRGMTNESQGAQ